MLTWLEIFNKAVAAVVMAEGYQHVQLHDYHGALSLMYMPRELRPAVMYVAHNAHYDARFPIPTPLRKHQVYELLNLTPDASTFIEHNGSVDILRPAVVHMREHQQGHGVVAVSPRYASQVSRKLSCFWDLAPYGRPRHIIGILNSLDMKDSLAAAALTLGEVLSIKASAKRRLQAQYGLAVGEQYSVATFVGRMTQQKGCDVIAEVAAALMAKHPHLQLVVLGPSGDPVGGAAAQHLWELSAAYPNRLYCPVDHYVSGPEKELLLQATDFCMLPSRFEPCGLVDVEFAWNGSIIIGHDTGGLGKMPGVYFTAQASHLEHLARKFEESVDKAMGLALPQRHKLQADALAKRFPVADMMQQYADAWENIDSSHTKVLATQGAIQRSIALQTSFFADSWSRCNQPAPASTAHAVPSAPAPPSSTGTSTPSVSDPRGDGNDRCIICIAGLSADKCCCKTAGADLTTDTHVPRKQRVSNRLMVVLQPLSLGPGILLLSFLLLHEVMVGSKHTVGLHLQDVVFGLLPQYVTMTGPLFMAFLMLSTVAAPLWFWLAARLQPATYIRMAAALVSISFALAFIALQVSQLFSMAVGLTAVTNLATCPFLSLGMLGQEGVDVFKVGRAMLALSESTKYGLLTVCLAIAAAATGPLPHQVVAGVLMLASGCIGMWICSPGCLGDAYKHMSLTLRGQGRFLLHLGCFWLSLVAGACDSLTMVLTGFLLVVVTKSLGLLATFQAIAFGCSVASVLWNWQVLRSRAAELRLNKAVLLLASLPFYQAAKAGVLLATLPTGAMLGMCATLDVLLAGRSSILGLAGFVTLPSREIVAIWQFAGIMVGSVGGVLVLAGAYASIQSGILLSPWMLFWVIAGLEGLRVVVMVAFAKFYPGENLSAP